MADLSKAIAGLDARKRELLALLAKREGVSLSRAPIVPVDRGAGPLPLSFSQERLWFLHQLEPGYTGYNLPLAFEIAGRLDIPVLERAFDEIFRRHEALRTTFTVVDGKPAQVIAPPAPLPLPRIDLSGFADPALADREVRNHIHEEAALPFDLERDAMLRLRLLRLAEDRHVLLGTLHHIASDGWSLGVVISELVKLYEAFSAGQPSPLPELPIQYADFAAWQRQALSGQTLESQLDFWRQALGGDLPPLELPADRPRPPVPGQRGTQYGVQVPPETASRLAALARAEEATLFMVLLAGFEVFLHRYSGQERFAVGTPIAGRNRVETEPLIGFFVNTLALRADLTGNPTFRELLARTRQVAVGAFGHQDLPFEKLVEELQPARDLSRTPVFQAVFSLQNTPPPNSYDPPGLEFIQLSGESVSALYDLILTAAEDEQELFLALNGRADLFEDATILGMLRQLVALFGGIAEDPGRAISEIPLLTAEEEQQVLLRGEGGAPVPGELPVPLQVAEQARRTPEALAVSGGGLELTYRELVERADRLARHLRGLGVGPESVVALRRERSPELVVEMLGTMLAGAAYLPLDPETPEERMAWVLNDSGATPSPTLPRSAGEGAPAPEIGREIWADNLAYVIYTSGSTGRPKGVEIPHSGLANLVRWHREAFGVQPGDRASQLAGLGFDAAVWEIWPYLAAGASVHLVPEDVRLDPEALAGWLAEQRISHVFVPTPMVEGLEPQLARRPGRLRFLLTGGDRLHRGPQRPLPFPLINNYGPTEATVVSTSGEVAAGGVRPPAIGQPISGTRAQVLDSGFRPVPVGVPGELYVGGAGLARGYRGRPDLTAERFRPNPYATEAGDRLYATGDRVRWLVEGGLEFLGRSDAQVKVRGFRIEPGEIEAVLASHPAVSEAAVLPREAAPGDVQLAAYVVLQDGGLEAVRDFLAARLPAYMVPASWRVLERLPLTPNGKVDRRALLAIPPDLDAARTGASRFVAPGTPTEEAVAALFAELLRRPAGEIGAEDSFFDLGGHSLLASRLASRLRERFDAGVSLRQIFETPTPASLAARIDSAQAPGTGTVPPPIRPRHAAPGEELPLSFAQQRLWFLDRMEPGGSFYNVPLAVRLAGALDVPVLEHTFQEIERRHQILRSVFPEAGGRAVQVVTPAARRPLPVVDLSALPEAPRRTEARRLATLEARRPFDLARGPLFRAGLLRLAPDDHAALLTLHHIVADGWSMGVLIRELGTLYSAFAAGQPSPLPELPIQYADFAAWQREWLEGEVLEQQLAYWRGQLAGAPAALDLPADHPRPALQSHRGAMRPFFAEPAVAEALRKLASRAEATPFMVLLAAFQTLLHRYTGQADVVVGSPVAVLGSAESESLIGLFTNMLVLRSDLSGDPGFRELLRRVREVALGAYSHQDLPFERLVEELRPARDLSRSPVFQVMFALQNTGGAALDLPGLALRPFESGGSGAARFDLTLDLSEGPGGIAGTIEYNLDLFEAATVDRLGAHLGTLLGGIAGNPDRHLSELPLLTAAERHQALAEWNDSGLPVAGPLAIHRQIEAQAERSPDVVALISGGAPLSYRELDRRAARAAGHLRSLGVGPESRVGVSLHRSADLVTALLAVLKAGAAYVPLDPGYPAERLAYVAADSGLAAVLVEPSTRERLAGTSVRTVLLADAVQGAEAPSQEPVSESAAYVIYTSGSTGRPKGVVVSHGNAVNFFAGMDAALLPRGWKPNGRESSPGTWLAVTSVSFDISVLELLWTLSRGFTVVVQPDAAVQPPPRAAAASRAIDFSLFYFAADEGAEAADRYRLLLEGARFADEHGFTAVWTPERHFHAFGGLYPNPSITGAALAGVTRRTQIRAGSVVLPLHNPIRVAEEWSLVDNLSGGRVGVSFASGWNVNDFALAPETYKDRKEVMFRHIETVRALWRGEAVRVLDGAGQSVELSILPRPIQPELPVWVTAAGNPETFRAAGEAGANLLTHLLGQSLPELADKIATYREARRQRPDGAAGHVSLMLHAFVGEDLDAVRERVREPFKSYLRSSLGLLTEMARTLEMNANLDNLAPEEMDALLTHAFDRYFEGAGLMGTVESCLEMVERLQEIGVDEVACLIDFGVETGAVLDSLERLDEVRRRSHRSQPAAPPQESSKTVEPEEDGSVAALIRRHGVTHLQCTPSMAGLLAADPESLAALGALRQLLLGGEALPETLVEKLPENLPDGLRNMYGPTETTVWSATRRVGRQDTPPGGTVPLGRPIANTGIVIADPVSLHPRPIGVPGELLIGGLGVTRGYLNRPDLTAERFVPDPFSGTPGARLYRTGDLARQRPDGTLEFRGRLDYQLKIRGYRIEPGEVEAALALHPAVRESVVIARQGATAGAEVRLVAYLVPREGVERTDEALSVTALRGFLLDRLPEPLVPSAFVLLDALPLTPNGKVDRKALPAPEGAKLGVATAWVAPQNELERAIAGVWQEVLGLERVGIHDNFFELGGTSLTIAQVHAELRRTLKRDFSMVELFRHPTIGALARHLAGDDTAAAVLAQVRERTTARAESLEKRREARRSQRDTRTAG